MNSRTPESGHIGSLWIDRSPSTWDRATVPLMSDAVLRASSVFDGMVAVRSDSGFELVAADAHVRRLLRSARVIGLDHNFSTRDVTLACQQVAATEANDTGARAVYVRPMLIGAALSNAVDRTSLVVTAFAQPGYFDEEKPTRLVTASLRRPSGDSLTPFAKATANYHLTRLVRLQASEAGFDDALLLNSSGRVAEAAGSAVLVELDGVLYTPPAAEDCLPSVTVDLVAEIAHEMSVQFERQPISIAQVHGADAIALAGTLAAVTPVAQLDHVRLGSGSVLGGVRKAYLEALKHRRSWRETIAAAGAPR